MKAAVSTSTAVFAISPSGQSAASYALAACREPSGIPPARVIDRRRVAAGGLAADDPASRIVVRRRAAAVGRRAADDIAARVVEGALLRRGCVGHHRERQQCEQDPGHGVCHDNTRIFLGQLIRECRKAIIVASREALLEHVVATVDQSVVPEAFYDRAALRTIGTWWRLTTKKPNNYGRAFCASEASGHTTAAPPINVMNSRRRIGPDENVPCAIPKL